VIIGGRTPSVQTRERKAWEVINKGGMCLGLVYRDGVLLMAYKDITDKLVVLEDVEKVYKIADHVGLTFSGHVSDARILVDVARQKAAAWRFIEYDEPIRIKTLVDYVCQIKQNTARYAWMRPFYLSMLIGGMGDRPALYRTGPLGEYIGIKAGAVGKNSKRAIDKLKALYRDDMDEADMDEAWAKQKAFKILKETHEPGELSAEKIECALIDSGGFRKLTQEEIESELSKLAQLEQEVTRPVTLVYERRTQTDEERTGG
jgi:proteasome alpha subunit